MYPKAFGRLCFQFHLLLGILISSLISLDKLLVIQECIVQLLYIFVVLLFFLLFFLILLNYDIIKCNSWLLSLFYFVKLAFCWDVLSCHRNETKQNLSLMPMLSYIWAQVLMTIAPSKWPVWRKVTHTLKLTTFKRQWNLFI